MALPAFPTPEIIPAGAGTAEISIDTEHQEGFTDEYGKFYSDPGILAATPNPGFEFDHFDVKTKSTNPISGETTYFEFTSTEIPFNSDYWKFLGARLDPPFEFKVASGHYLLQTDIEWYGPRIETETGSKYYQLSLHTEVVFIKAYFKQSPVGNGQIIYGDGGAILCSNKSDGMPLYDDGTEDQ